MRLTLLGTGSPIPDPTRAGPATLVEAAGRRLLFDCGRGVLLRAAAAGLGPAGVHRLFLTHLHSDHTTDLNDLLTTRWVMSPGPLPLAVTGPPGTARLVERTLAMLADDVAWRRAHHDDLDWDPPVEVTELEDGVALEEDGLVVRAAPTEHRPVRPTLAYRVEADGRAVVLAGDTLPCDGLDRLCAGADVLVQTVVRRALVEAVPLPRFQDVLDYHSGLAEAAATATRGRVRTLVLTHCVPPPAPGTEAEWEAEAAAGFDGTVVAPPDLWSLEL